MLRVRVVSALVLIPLLVSAILFLSVENLAILLALIVLLAAWEWSGLAGFTSLVSRIAYVLLSAFLMYKFYSWFKSGAGLHYLLNAVFVWWLFVLLWISISALEKMLASALNVYLRGFIGLILLLPAWVSLLLVHNSGPQGPFLLLGLFVLIWVADSGAYFTGRIFGRNKLAPAISPGKTIEGVYGALFASLLTALIISLVAGFDMSMSIAYMSIALFCVIFSIVGDLFESVAKRVAGVKDSGSLIPGHGGVMDRIDSLTAAGPLYLLGLSWFPEFL
ncbi:MAG: phosphatidate cytidylyltransferase [Gammaproteobacteria bacterium]|nr:MAG: phosphatidate cytidylyltransferase [Gammaproteobacteria bacterium]